MGDLATLETRASVGAHTTIETGGMLTALSWLPQGERVRAHQRWSGVPAAPDGAAAPVPALTRSQCMHPALHAVLHIAAVGVVRAGAAIPALAVLATLTAALGLTTGDVVSWLRWPVWSVASVSILVAATVLWVPI